MTVRPGYTTEVKVERVIDGDTIEVSMTKNFVVRLTDDKGTYDTPEIRGSERPLGEKAKARLAELLKDEKVLLFIPTENSGDVGSLFCIGGRVVGQVYVGGRNVADIMAEEGHNEKGKAKSENEEKKRES